MNRHVWNNFLETRSRICVSKHSVFFDRFLHRAQKMMVHRINYLSLPSYHQMSSFYNAHMTRHVRDHVKSCATFQRNKCDHLHPVGLLQPLPVPSAVWSNIAMDFVEGFPKVGGKSVILTFVDRFSKYAHFIALRHPYSAISVARTFF